MNRRNEGGGINTMVGLDTVDFSMVEAWFG